MELVRELDMASLSNLPLEEQAHWELHLNAVIKDSPKLEVDEMLASSVALPNIEHPSYIHDWLEYPERRAEIERWE